MQDRQAQAVHAVFADNSHTRIAVCAGGSAQALQIHAHARPVQQLGLFAKLQAVAQAPVDVALQLRNVSKDLLIRGKGVADGHDVGAISLERDIRLRQRGDFGALNRGVICECQLLEELDGRLRRGAPHQQVTDGQALHARRDDARNVLRNLQGASAAAAAGDRVHQGTLERGRHADLAGDLAACDVGEVLLHAVGIYELLAKAGRCAGLAGTVKLAGNVLLQLDQLGAEFALCGQ